jgi:outer membrane protein OmpA-like peptidoglycan-associated protein
MEAKKQSISMTTVILPTSRKIRADLWQKAADWKNHSGFPCGEDLVAQLEVQLVWAGHEDNQLGWRHAKPYLQAAERLAKEAGRKIDACAVPAAAPSLPPSSVDAATPDRIQLSSGTAIPDRVHFALNRDILSSRSAAILERVAAVMQANPEITVELRGYADERGTKHFNEILSLQRAEVVRTYLAAAGVRRARISVKAFGSASPFMSGSDADSHARNRRVELIFSPASAVTPAPQFDDIQAEGN